MMQVKEVIVVEGRDDTQRIKLAVDADTIETNGSAIDREVIDQIKHAQAKRGVIVFTDPDFPGEKIRKIISREVPGVKHAFLTQDEARPSHKGSLGIEHASRESIRQALSAVYTEQTNTSTSEPVSKAFLMKHGLIARPNSAELRAELGRRLRIGYTNGKQLQKRLALFGLTEADVESALAEITRKD
ncbi:ribonuclease M5 [Dolosigranulum pigrum]|nr:ribonuclease M5 [Dolosigranulum pigrum]